MAKVRFKTTVYREGEIPLVDDAPPVVPAEPAVPEYEPPRLRLCAVLAACWYIGHAAIIGAAIIYVTFRVDAQGYCTSPLQPIGAVILAPALWGITLTMRACARREQP